MLGGNRIHWCTLGGRRDAQGKRLALFLRSVVLSKEIVKKRLAKLMKIEATAL